MSLSALSPLSCVLAVSLLIDEPPAPVSAELVEEEPVIEEATLPSPTLVADEHEEAEAIDERQQTALDGVVEEDSAAVAALMSRGGGDNQSVTESSADDMPTPHHTSATAAVLAAAAPHVSITYIYIYTYIYIHYILHSKKVT